METRKLVFRSEMRVSGGKSPKIEGSIPYLSLSQDLGGFREQLLPGVFSQSIKSGERIISLWGHDDRQPLGSTNAQTLILEDTPTELRFTIIPPHTSWGRDAIESIQRGDTEGVSFGFNNIKDSWETQDDQQIRNVEQAKLIEISPVSFPAYQQTSINIRSKKAMTEQEIRLQMGDLAKKAEDIIEKANSEKRQMEKSENNEFVVLMTRRDELGGQLQALGKDVVYFRDEGLEGVKRWGSTSQYEPTKNDPNPPGYETRTQLTPEMRAFNNYLVNGRAGLGREELRALQMDSDVQAGFMISPEKFVRQVLKKLDDLVFLRKYCTHHECKNAHSLGQPYLADDPDDSDWCAELSTGAADSTMRLEKRVLYPQPSAKRLLVSDKLLRASEGAAGNLVRDRLAYKFSITEEKSFMTGNGANQPLGLMVAHASGIGTDRDCSTGNTTTALKADNLIECEAKLKAPYRRNAKWIFHRDTIKMIRKLKTGDGDYLWIQGLQGAPTTILDYPFLVSEYMENTFTTGLYIGIFGDLSFYHVATALDMQIKVLNELYAASNQVGFIGRMEVDGMPAISEAFVRVKLG